MSIPSVLQAPLSIGGVPVPNRAFLAPMSGVSDLPFRRLAARFGAGLVVSEMVACGPTAKSEEARLRAEGKGLSLHVVQLCGRDPDAMAEGARIAEGAGASIIDINMGCPARSVTTGAAGSALMREPDSALRMVEAVVRAARVPVTLKMRLGWDEHSMNAPDLAAKAEAAGVRMITVHGRTRCQFYKGRADWTAIRKVRAAISIPLVANGDLTDLGQAPAMLAASGADAVMIGRGSYGRPWMVGRTGAFLAGAEPPPEPEGEELRDLVLEHHEAMLSHYGLTAGIRIARKHLGWYLDLLPEGRVPPNARRTLLTDSDPAGVERLIRSLFGAEPERAAA